MKMIPIAISEHFTLLAVWGFHGYIDDKCILEKQAENSSMSALLICRVRKFWKPYRGITKKDVKNLSQYRRKLVRGPFGFSESF